MNSLRQYIPKISVNRFKYTKVSTKDMSEEEKYEQEIDSRMNPTPLTNVQVKVLNCLKQSSDKGGNIGELFKNDC